MIVARTIFCSIYKINRFSRKLRVNAAAAKLCSSKYLGNPSRLCEKNMSTYGVQTEEDIGVYARRKDAMVVNLRSDTFTKPSEAMRVAMSKAAVGDDVFGEDPTVNELEAKAAKMVGMEAGLFVPSGTMGNLIAIMVHCNERGCEAYCGEESHTMLHEQGGAAQLAGVTLCPIANNPDGSFDLKTLRSKLRRDRLHEPTSRLVIVENPMNGRIVARTWIEELATFAKERKLKLHMDGARLWNAVVASQLPASDVVRAFDSVTFCLSKGLGAPVGSVLCGSRDFVEQARRARKVLGGGMRQVGVLAAAGIVAIDETIPMLERDHHRARKIAAAINNNSNDSKGLNEIDLRTVETNMVFVYLRCPDKYDAMTFVKDLSLVEHPEEPKVVVQALALNDTTARLVLHRDIDDEMVDAAIRKIIYVLNK